ERDTVLSPTSPGGQSRHTNARARDESDLTSDPISEASRDHVRTPKEGDPQSTYVLNEDGEEPPGLQDHAGVAGYCWRCGAPASALDAALEPVCDLHVQAGTPPELTEEARTPIRDR